MGTHTAEFAGVPATGREVRIPLVVSYRVAEEQIQEAHVYMLVASFLQQVGAAQ